MRNLIRQSCSSPSRLIIAWLCLLYGIGSVSPLLGNQPPDELPPPILSSLDDRLLKLEQQSSTLTLENRRLAEQLDEFRQRSAATVSPPSSSFLSDNNSPRVGYDNGLFISSADDDQFPFQLRFNNQSQIRYVSFQPSVATWEDGAGNVSSVTERSAFELTRGRAIFSGYAFDSKLTYNLSIDYTTVSASQLNFWTYWLSYEFNRRFSLFIGQGLVPGTREWLTPYLFLQGPDYSLATTFFRPSLSQGVWASGELTDSVKYRAMLSNGFNTLGSSQQQLDSRMTMSGSIWAEPLGPFGPGFSDFEWHHSPAVRLGTSFTQSPNRGQQGNANLPENVDLRLTNGTLLTQTGALAPGVTLNSYTVSLGAIDIGWKYQGFSISSELYLRELSSLKGDGPVPRSSIFDYGGYAQCGYFVQPKTLELYARTSQIAGPYGSGSEYAGGANYFLLPDKQNLRFTFDAAWVNHSPADQARTDYRAGDTGLLIRAQFQFFF